MKTLQPALFLFMLATLVKSAPPIQQEPINIYDYGTDDGQLFKEENPQGANINKKGTTIFDALFQGDEGATKQPPSTNDVDLPTCLLCVCLSGSVYCEETNIDTIPPLPKETAYLYARFNKIKKITAKDFADFPTLKRIDLTGNLIEEIEDGAFSKLLLLDQLSLAENKLVKIPALPPKLTVFNANSNKIKSRGIKANAFKKLNDLSYLYLAENELESVPQNLPESLRILHLQENNITSITDDTFCKSNNTRYVRERMAEVRLDGNPVILGKYPNSFTCLKRLPTGAYF
ncbi:mimecan [Microcaecilia unicolor]|uniref:Mimecan n=1 Tax=Microcaecilia unicolor TaxID=1415580 RepID=A0A6P7YD63_9AMPH|nr:mimecan [Microcaecilia unicolor]